MPKKKKTAIDDLGDIAIGTAGLGIGLGVGSAIANQGNVNMGNTFTTIAGFGSIAVTGLAGHTVLKSLKQKKGKKKFGEY